jgi:uncharacterized phage-associated protein
VEPYDAMTVAKWFVKYARADDGDISNLKLQKLLYYAQGYRLARSGAPLFSDRIEAWSHGPVVPAVYQAYKRFGSGDVDLDPDDPFSWSDVDKETTQFLIEVWEAFGGFGAWRLRNMTHSEDPWRSSFEQDVSHIEITQDSLRTYFSTRA